MRRNYARFALRFADRLQRFNAIMIQRFNVSRCRSLHQSLIKSPVTLAQARLLLFALKNLHVSLPVLIKRF